MSTSEVVASGPVPSRRVTLRFYDGKGELIASVPVDTPVGGVFLQVELEYPEAGDAQAQAN